ncbi:hypothetical protein CNR22_08945 [Sphingobacteriaceae bacterium]|nr:hypothetical protein CNR22_08945 [Sphingobacteriaceae bacterium]
MKLRLFLFCLLLFNFFFLSAQKDLKYFLDGNKKFVDSTKASFYAIYKTNPDTVVKSGSVETYFMNGKLLKRVEYKYKADGSKKENQVYYYQNGKVGERITTIDVEVSEMLSYFPNGILKRKIFYNDSEILSEQCFGWTGKDTVCYDDDARKPQYIGGMDALMAFIKKNIKYPAEARGNKISGTVQVGLVVDRQGAIESLYIQKSVHPLLDAEALRVLRTMPRWMPGLYRDELLPKYESIPVVFELPK